MNRRDGVGSWVDSLRKDGAVCLDEGKYNPFYSPIFILAKDS